MDIFSYILTGLKDSRIVTMDIIDSCLLASSLTHSYSFYPEKMHALKKKPLGITPSLGPCGCLTTVLPCYLTLLYGFF